MIKFFEIKSLRHFLLHRIADRFISSVKSYLRIFSNSLKYFSRISIHPPSAKRELGVGKNIHLVR